jgi:hypothetical protein
MSDLRTLIGSALADAERVGYHRGTGGITVQDLRHAQGSREWLEEETDRQFGELRAEVERLRALLLEAGAVVETYAAQHRIRYDLPEKHPKHAELIEKIRAALNPTPEPTDD